MDLFLEADYDALTFEAYSKAIVTTERLKNGIYPTLIRFYLQQLSYFSCYLVIPCILN